MSEGWAVQLIFGQLASCLKMKFNVYTHTIKELMGELKSQCEISEKSLFLLIFFACFVVFQCDSVI